MSGEPNPKAAAGALKAPMSAVPVEVLAELGLAMLEGELKYGRYNFRASAIEVKDYYDAFMRHVRAYWAGEDIDPKSGMPHIIKAMATLVVLRCAQINGTVIDNRPPKILNMAEFFEDLDAKAAELVARYGDLKPKHFTITEPGNGQ